MTYNDNDRFDLHAAFSRVRQACLATPARWCIEYRNKGGARCVECPIYQAGAALDKAMKGEEDEKREH